MIRNLLILLFLSFSTLGFSQSISLDQDTLILQTLDLDQFEYVLYGHLNNESSSSQRYVWEKEKINCPEDWTVSMCIGELCYFHTVHSKEEGIGGNESQEFSMHLADTKGESGQCDVCVKFVVVGETDTILGCQFWTLGATSNNESEPVNISFYPNPVQNYLNISNDISMDITIANALGQTMIVRTTQVGTNQINLSDFNRGVYTISFYHEGENILTKQFVKK